MAIRAALAFRDDRAATRDEVHYRTRATGPDKRPLELLLVNISAQGLMARCDAPLAPGDRIAVTLPGLGAVPAEVRWALGGRIGCELASKIAVADYYDLLAALLKGKG
ncbi:PilZ domain-containing protein [Sphingomonas sp.]|uniref:PilZ domain-containing protein n=1 Tax=Sphingomonas sp. TaxID=28214 RepID=UPI001D99B4DE|nr:PilZ domain-containing protein [Sphingomonas sp.]MBX9797113.1 PilZ domain-containing protein [Sphingomonas sp.]